MLSGDLSFVGGGTIITIARAGGCSVGNRELWSQLRWWCRFWMRFVGGRLCLFVVVYSGYCGWLRFSEDSGS